jgi:hypothetical protein
MTKDFVQLGIIFIFMLILALLPSIDYWIYNLRARKLRVL